MERFLDDAHLAAIVSRECAYVDAQIGAGAVDQEKRCLAAWNSPALRESVGES